MGGPEEILAILSEVKDPEIPVLNVVEMGIVRDVRCRPDGVEVAITPTYSGCPAMRAIEESIGETLANRGFRVAVKTVLFPAWTTDWMTEDAREKLRRLGIAPPEPLDGRPAEGPPAVVECPFCDSADTELRSDFGSTPCKALHYCNGCHQPFERFKCI